MFNALLVDDEPLALEGLRMLPDWESAGFAVRAQASGGQEALSLVERAMPDLLVTDLKMPGIGGLELIRRLRERGFDGEIVVVSGYAEFSMAREALRMGVLGYLLKPLDLEECAAVLGRANQALHAREERRLARRHEQVARLLRGQPSEPGALPDGGWALACWGVPLEMDVSAGLLEAARAVGATATLHILNGREWMALQGEAPVLDAACDSLIRALDALGRDAALAREIPDAAALRAAYDALSRSLDDHTQRLGQLTDALTHAVHTLDVAAARQAGDTLRRFCCLRGARALQEAWDLLSYHCEEMVARVPQKAQQLRGLLSNTPDFCEFAEACIRIVTPPRQNGLSSAVIEYAAHHMDERLTIDVVAEALGYNPAYLGRCFREETGGCFRDALRSLRMRRAAELLEATRQPVFQIAEAVGYTNQSAFRRHFQEAFGSLPDEYRRGKVNP